MNDLLNLVPAINATEDEMEKTEREYKKKIQYLSHLKSQKDGMINGI